MRVFYGKQFIAATSAASLCVTGCVRVPDMDSPLDTLVSGPSEVLVIDLTRRVKCELYQALSDRLPDIYRDEHRKFIDKNGKPIPKGGLPQFDETSQNYWLSKWNTTVKLELQLNNQGGISPGVSFTQLLPNYYNFAGGASLLPVGPGLDAFGLGKPVSTYAPTAAAVSQNFTLGLGGGVTTQAVRTEDVQFTVSMAELVKEFDPNGDWARAQSEHADSIKDSI